VSVSLRDPILLSVTDPSQIGEARRVGVGLAERIGFTETRRAELAIVLTEAATNVLKHARGGELILRPLDRDGVSGVEVLAVDRGPGIGNVVLAMRDGFSTGGTAGNGLGAIGRLATEFDLFSAEAKESRGAGPGYGFAAAVGHAAGGTVLLARLWSATAVPPPPGGLEVGVVCLPMPGEEACGDAWALEVDGRTGRAFVVVADGLGHGLHAADASRQAIRVFRDAASRASGPGAILKAMHDGLRGTRGAAVAVAELPTAAGGPKPIRFAGIGNIAGVLVGSGRSAAGGGAAGGGGTAGADRNLISHNGTLGAEARRFQEFEYPADPGGLLVMHSDGLGSRWQLADYPGLRNRHPAVVAGVLFRDQRRLRDDATALVVRLPGGSPAAGAAS
jgi:anti-sigma regulatory factor (Ser/Thr protein kinase)